MIKVLMFDLDGTLVGLDTDEFVKHYLEAVALAVKDKFAPKQFAQNLMAASYAMIQDTRAELLNMEKFNEHFYSKLKSPMEDVAPLFDEFYANHFPKLNHCASVVEGAAEVLDYAIENDYELVLATNPIFPEAAVRERMRWAGVEEYPFSLVTTYENMHHAKPQVAFYEEILQRTGHEPSECLMVGNDSWEDMIASKLGIKTFFIDNYPIIREDKHIDPDYRGSFMDLLCLLKQKAL